MQYRDPVYTQNAKSNRNAVCNRNVLHNINVLCNRNAIFNRNARCNRNAICNRNGICKRNILRCLIPSLYVIPRDFELLTFCNDPVNTDAVDA